MNAKKLVVFVVGLLLLVVFLSLMFTYQVRSNEIVLVHYWSGPPEIKYGSTTIMSEKVVKERNDKKLPENDAGIQFRLPWPLQKVLAYLTERLYLSNLLTNCTEKFC